MEVDDGAEETEAGEWEGKQEAATTSQDPAAFRKGDEGFARLERGGCQRGPRKGREEATMRRYRPGQKLDLLTRHQENRKFAADSTIGEVIEGTDGHDHKMRVRVYRESWHPEKGYLHELLRVTDTIWLERVGTRLNKDGTTNLPHVHEIIGELSEQEFHRRHAELNHRKTK